MKIINLFYFVIFFVLMGGSGGADYGSITLRAGENITLDGGQLWNYTNRGIDSASLGAIGDGTADDTDALQDTIDYAASNNTRAFFTGTEGSNFRITSPLILPSGTSDNIFIDGLSSHTNILVDLDDGEYAFTDNGSFVGGLVIKNLDIVPYGEKYNVCGINISSTVRGLEINNVRVFGLENGIKISGSIWAKTILNNVGCYLSPLNNSTGVIINGNAVYCYGLEVVGYAQGVTWTGSVGGIYGGVISGSPGYAMNESIVFDNAYDIAIHNIWIEEMNETKYGTGLARGIEITDSESIYLDGVHFAAGCLYIHNGTVHMSDSAFYQSNGAGGYGKITVLNGGSLVSENTYFDPASDASYSHSTICTGNISAYDGYDNRPGADGKFSDPTLYDDLIWFWETNGGLVDSSYDAIDFVTGNKSYNVTTSGAYQGIYFNATGLPRNLPCTVTALVKCNTPDANVYITALGSTSTSEDYTGPSQSIKNAGDNWRKISSTLKTTDGRIDAKIISTTNAVFKVDSINVYPGIVDYAPY